MAYVPSAERYGFSLRLDEEGMREVLNGKGVKGFVAATGETVREGVVTHVQAVATAENAANYVASMFVEDSFSDDYGFDFNGPFALGNRPIAVIGVPAGRGVIPAAKPPLMVEAETHALTSVRGVEVGGGGEDIR